MIETHRPRFVQTNRFGLDRELPRLVPIPDAGSDCDKKLVCSSSAVHLLDLWIVEDLAQRRQGGTTWSDGRHRHLIHLLDNETQAKGKLSKG